MIPFASERGYGQDLATHLHNAHDNEFIEIADLRGAVARDLHGAFAEWEAQARALTRCKNYLCSLSVNPDQLQGRLTRDQYLDYIARAEDKLGLAGQPRAVVFHIKQDKDGKAREHCHVVWSRIDVEAGKAVGLPFFKDKLMTVSREFARDHGLELPEGYYRHEQKQLDQRRRNQLTRYDNIREKETGISKEERMAAITEAWRTSDSGAAFVNALEELGYVLATGKRDFVLVDIYGHTNALPKMIDDRSVKTKDVRERLGAEYAPDKLPTVERAQAVAADRRRAVEDFEKARAESEQVALLIRQQKERRTNLDGKRAMLETAQTAKRQMLLADQLTARRRLRAELVSELRQRRAVRARSKPKGLAAFLGRITGVELITKKLHAHRDRQRMKTYRADKNALMERQAAERDRLDRRLDVQAADLRRECRALDAIEKKELSTLQQKLRREHRRQDRDQRKVHSPTFSLDLKPGGRPAAPHKAASRHISENKRALEEQERQETAFPPKKKRKRIDLIDAFTRAAGDDDDDGGGGGGDTGGQTPKPPNKPGPDRPNRRNTRRRRRDRGKDIDRGM